MKRRPPSRFILMDDLTQVVLGWYASEEEAYRSPEWASAAHPVVVPITDDPSAEADEAAYTAALRAMAVARREAQVRAVEARGWTSTGDVWVSPDGRTRYVPGRDVWESWRWLPDVPGGGSLCLRRGAGGNRGLRLDGGPCPRLGGRSG